MLIWTGHAEAGHMFLGGTVKPGVITAPLGFNWPRNSLIDKCCEQAREEAGGLHPWPQRTL